MEMLRNIACKLPIRWQHEIQRIRFARQVKRKCFASEEKEFDLLGQWISEGDWVVDIGANVGHYTVRFSSMVGETGRVIAIEPVPETFSLLAANAALLPLKNVSLFNVAASMSFDCVGMSTPTNERGLANYYMAHIADQDPSFNVISLPIDSLGITQPISLVKIDTEGHELSVIEGMKNIVLRDRPTLIIEDNSAQVIQYLKQFGYCCTKNQNSPNLVFQAK
jgi:FkbM family methyltransferase